VKAILLKSTGGPEVLKVTEVPTPEPAAGEVLVKAHAIGVSMPEMLVRRGVYAWMPPLPAIIGIEMSGTVAALGAGVAKLKVGDPVFISARELPVRGGCYAEYIAVPERAAFVLPAGVNLDAAACLSNYQVAWHLLHSAPRGMQYDSVLASAAAGGVGSALVQLASIAGKRLIGLAGSEEKLRFIELLGAAAAINYKTTDVAARVRALTAGAGVDMVLDSVGGPNFNRNFDYLAPLGMVINYGLLDGYPEANAMPALRARLGDSLGMRFFSMHAFDQLPARRIAATAALSALLASGRIRPAIHARLPLAEAARAHRLFESGTVMGKLLLKP
jgi:NADPH2:quinone reductase